LQVERVERAGTVSGVRRQQAVCPEGLGGVDAATVVAAVGVQDQNRFVAVVDEVLALAPGVLVPRLLPVSVISKGERSSEVAGQAVLGVIGLGDAGGRQVASVAVAVVGDVLYNVSQSWVLRYISWLLFSIRMYLNGYYYYKYHYEYGEYPVSTFRRTATCGQSFQFCIPPSIGL
jgi:hypothetical protein